MATHDIYHKDKSARGRFNDATNEVTITSGSILNIDLDVTPPSNIAANYRDVINRIAVGDIQIRADGRLDVVHDIAGLSPSGARVFADGKTGSGWKVWYLEADGKLLDTLRVNTPPVEKSPLAFALQKNTIQPVYGHGRKTVLQVANRDDYNGPFALPPLPDYLAKQADYIRALGTQDLPPWPAKYDQIPGEVMVRLRQTFPRKIIKRDDLGRIFSDWNDPAMCLIAAMIWGGIQEDHLEKLLKHDEQRLKKTMHEIRILVSSGELEKAFDACLENGRLKLPGVGPSFFTKIFFFIGQTPFCTRSSDQVMPIQAINPTPLILDKWTAHALCVLGAQACGSFTLRQYFDIRPLCSNDKDPVFLKKPVSEIYRIYINWMNHWAELLGVTPDKLEQFVFGVGRKTKAGKDPKNPRNELLLLGKAILCDCN